MSRLRNVAEVLGKSKTFVWVKVPLWEPHIIFTLPREWLKHGTATASKLEVEYDPKSASFDGTHFTADLEIISVIERMGTTARSTGSLDSEGPG